MTPADVARLYERCLAAAAAAGAGWAGRDPAACAVAEWLAGCWAGACPAPPAGPPDATSRVGHEPAGVRWFAGDGTILGYVAGHAPGCYRVPPGAPAPGAAGLGKEQAADD